MKIGMVVLRCVRNGNNGGSNRRDRCSHVEYQSSGLSRAYMEHANEITSSDVEANGNFGYFWR